MSSIGYYDEFLMAPFLNLVFPFLMGFLLWETIEIIETFNKRILTNETLKKSKIWIWRS